MRSRSIATCFVLSLAVSALASAADVTLSSSQDNTIYGFGALDNSNGVGWHLFAGATASGSERRALMQFDLSSIPAGSTINSVQLTLTLDRGQNNGTHTLNLHRLLSDWGEGTSDAPGSEGAGTLAAFGDATWNFRYYNIVSWTTPGGDFVATASAGTVVSGIGRYSWSSAQMATDVQNWLDGTAANNGWVLIGNETALQTAKRFQSRENPNPDVRPSLLIDFTPPATDGACCLVDDSCQLTNNLDCDALQGVFQGIGTNCGTSPCAGLIIGACCVADGTCTITTNTICTVTGGSFQGDGAACTPNPCPQPVGACCQNNGSCTEVSETDCLAATGTFQGIGTICTPGLCPVILEPFVDDLTIPPLATPTSGAPGAAATYDIPIVQINQKLHRDLPPTPVWTYNGTYPGPTILARTDEPVTVNWINDLRNPDNTLRTDHLLDVDLCPHGAEDAPKVVVHLHGGHVPAAVDGYPEFTFLPGQMETYVYPNGQLPGTIWYHDHALGITRLNVYAGLAGAYVITDAFEEALGLPAGEFDVPLIIQDRNFNADGSLQYPSAWTDHYVADNILVNGTVWPKFDVKQGKYRFRVLNGCNSRTLRLALSNAATFQLIGTDGGLIESPISVNELLLAPAERADVIVDFASYAPGTEIILENSAPAPFPGSPGVGVVPNVMKFIVTAQGGFTDPVPAALRPYEELDEANAVQSRDFELSKVSEPCAGAEWLINGLGWDDITEQPVLGTTEVWRFINRSGMMHPMHIHLDFFQILDRQAFQIIDDEVVPVGPLLPIEPTESGWKDTVQVGPQEMVRLLVRFEDYTGLFPYHCHILEHEDHEMMRQFETVCVKGDTNQDTLVNAADIAMFVTAVVGGADEGTAIFCAADVNDDAVLDATGDIDLFVDCLLAGGCP